MRACLVCLVAGLLAWLSPGISTGADYQRSYSAAT
jgi:hypothetical protein